MQIDEPFTGPIHVLVRRSAASIVDEALETKVTVTYTADTEVLDLESIDDRLGCHGRCHCYS